MYAIISIEKLLQKCTCNKFWFLIFILLAIFYHVESTGECDSLDIRNDCESFKILENCTVIKGFLMIVLLPKDKYTENGADGCNFTTKSFPLLREITDYLLFFHVKGLKSIRDMFPNLTVIRGRRLFLNYAIGISEMPDLEAIEFRALVAIQRGHVYIGSSPKLCQLEMINWDRLTLTTGPNHIFPVSPELCKEKAVCRGCEPKYCWSNDVCQKFENDNVLNLAANTKNCHEECLGGCRNRTNADCAVCRGLTDHGLCVKKCPDDKFEDEHSQRCYTREECVKEMNLFTHDRFCVSHCPSGYKPNNDGNCTYCGNDEACLNVCKPESKRETFIPIYNLGDIDLIAGCEIINSSLMIIIRNKIDENDLAQKFSTIHEVRGYIKIYRSPYLTTLAFLNNLRKIGGHPSEIGPYSLIIYDNKNLKELWRPQPNFELEHGGMYIHLNNKLCNHNILEFSENVKHDRNLDSIQTSDQETLCGPVKLLLDIQVLSHHELLFSWQSDQTYDEIELMYRPVHKTEPFEDETELDTPICQRINWRRELIFKKELNGNGTHYSYIVEGLQQNTRYACLIKTFGTSYKQTARSDLVFMLTKADIPPPPKIEVVKKTNISLTIELNSNNNNSLDYDIDHYLLQVYEKSDDVVYLDKRNYCKNPVNMVENLLTGTYINSDYDEDYDDCCDRLEERLIDERFMADIEAEFSCSLNRKKHCLDESSTLGAEKPIRDLRLPKNETKFEIEYLKSFHLYVLTISACNMIGCSSYSFHSERTNYTTKADLVDGLEGCRMPNSTEYRVFFTEPKNPNGVIVSYVVHLRNYIPTAKHYHIHISCVTRLDHIKAENMFVRYLNSTFNQVAVRAHSLAGDTITDWLNITPCDAAFMAATTKLAGFNNNKDATTYYGTKRGLNIFLIFFLIGCAGTIIWVCYKRRYWRRFPELWQFFTSYNRTQIPHILIHDDSSLAEDRQILVDNFETVRFHNRQSDDDDNDTTVSSMSDF